MLSSLCLAYVHLRLKEVFGSSQWFGAMNVLLVGDILQLPPVNGSMVFQNIFCNKVIAATLGCMTSVNIWRETVQYDELTINERQKQDPEFCHLLMVLVPYGVYPVYTGYTPWNCKRFI